MMDIDAGTTCRKIDSQDENDEDEGDEELPEHVPLNAREARHTIKGPKQPKAAAEVVGVDALTAKERKDKAKAFKKSSTAPKGKKRVEKTRTYTNAKGMLGE